LQYVNSVVEQYARTIFSRTYLLLDFRLKVAFGICKKTLCESMMLYGVEFAIQNTRRPHDTTRAARPLSAEGGFAHAESFNQRDTLAHRPNRQSR
jgi:hypothetical protein